MYTLVIENTNNLTTWTCSVICCNDSNLFNDKMLMSHVYIVIVLVICCNNFFCPIVFLEWLCYMCNNPYTCDIFIGFQVGYSWYFQMERVVPPSTLDLLLESILSALVTRSKSLSNSSLGAVWDCLYRLLRIACQGHSYFSFKDDESVMFTSIWYFFG